MFTTDKIKRLDLPHEAGTWVEIKPMSVKVYQAARQADGSLDAIIAMAGCITAWSYDRDVTQENVADLDVETAGIVADAIFEEQDRDQNKPSKRSTRR